MKKLIGGLLAAFLMSTGLVAFSGSVADAACPYQGCVDTTTAVSAPAKVKQGKKATIKVVVASSGNTKAKGTVKVTVTGPGGYTFKASQAYKGSALTFVTSSLKKTGKYVVTAKFDGTSKGFAKSSGRDTFKVTR